MVRQVNLFTPGDERRMVEKSLRSDADMIVLDIEDAVAPSQKQTAGETIRDVLNETSADEITVEVTVRINPLETRGEQDLANIADASDKIAGIVLPKVRGAGTVEDLAELMDGYGIEAAIMPIIENPECLLRIEEIATHPRVDALEFGAEDFTTELGGLHTHEREEILYARQKVVVAAAAAGIDAIDMAWPDYQDTEGLRRNARKAVEFGYDGKSAIHPVQIEVIRDAFMPNDDQIEWAQKVVAGAEEAEKEGKVVFQLEGEMIDPPIINRAHDILERAG